MFRSLLLSAILAGVALACAGRESAAAFESPTTLDPNLAASSLSLDEQKRYCRETRAYAQERTPDDAGKKILCASSGVESARGSDSPTAACEEAFAACFESAVTSVATGDRCENLRADTFAGCDATVGQLATCFRERVAAYVSASANAGHACSLNPPRLDGVERRAQPNGSVAVGPVEPESCRALASKCPAAMGER